ncbi:MAG TPA: PAS domain S-box protein, partial [Rhodocyclaceae bacterium]
LIDAIPNPVFYKDADGRYREINSAFEDTVGKARAEILGKTPLELWPHDVAERYAATDRQLFDSPGSLMYEAQIETPRGRRHAIFHKATLRWADGTVRGQIGVCIDITERKNMERALLASQADLAAREQEFRSLAESSPDHIIRYDLDHRILYLNGCLMRALGFAGPDEVLGRRPIEVWPDGRFAAIDAAVDAAVATGEARTVHLDVDTGKGRVRHDQVLVVPERDRGGKIVGTLAFGRDITAIRETELALENHLAFTRELIEAIPDPVFYKDTEGRYLGFNTAFERSVGRKREEMIGKGVFELWPRDLAERYFAADRHLIENPGSQVYEAQMQTTDGRRDVVFHKATFTRADGTVGGQIGSYIDITERKRMEAELQEAATLHGTLLDAVNEAGLQLMIIEDGRIDYVSNRRIAHEFGYGDDDIDARPPLLDLVHPDDRMRVADMHRRRVNGEDVPRTYELGLVTRSGERREYETSAIVVPGSDPLRIVTVAKDISERKRHEEELQRREEEFKALAENSPDVIVRYDRECRRTYVNGAYEELHLIPAEALRGKTILEAGPLGEQERAVLHDMVANVIARGQPSAIETAWQRSDGRSFSYHIRAVPELDRHGKVTGALTVARDITVLKQTERRLEQSQELLQRLSVRREEEYEGERRRVAHELHEEFGQMLTALRINISTLPLQYGQQLPALRQRSESMLELVDRTIQSMRDVVTSLRPPVLDAGISAGLGWLVREFNSKAGIPCSLHAPDVGRAIDDGAAALVLRVVQEALSNVALHARASQVLVRFEREDRAWCAEVRDDGRGFDAGSESHKSLGRFGMEQCALMLGGTLEIDSAPGRGTVLRMNFPAA